MIDSSQEHARSVVALLHWRQTLSRLFLSTQFVTVGNKIVFCALLIAVVCGSLDRRVH